MDTNQTEFITQALNESGTLSPASAAQLLELSMQGDTGALSPEQTEQPGSAPSQESATDEASKTDQQAAQAQAQPAKEGDPANLSPDNAVILAKDGKHTISYDRLVEARQAAQAYKAQAEAAQAALAQLQAQAAARAAAGQAPTQTDTNAAAAQAAIAQGVDPGVFGDFSEEALAKGIQAVVEARVAAEVQRHVAKALEPIQAKTQQDMANQHYNAIYAAHPDADSLVESKELADWVAAQPSFARTAYAETLRNGTTAEVIELFDRFKQATGVTQQAAKTPSPEEIKAAAKAAVQSAPIRAPASLTDFPGGRPNGLSINEQMAGMNSHELLDQMTSGNMTPAQIEAFLNTL